MSEDETAALRKLGQDMRYWKKFAFPGFAAGVLNLDAAIKSIDSPDPFIYARQDYPARWLVCKVGTQHKAMFHTAAVWAGSSHLDTGNYVPEGQAAPTNLPESRIQRNPSNRCQIDYIIDTRYDKTLFGHQAAFETLLDKQKEFNKGGKPRRSWQKGDDGYDSTFTLSAQVFVRPYGYDVAKLKNVPYELHPWIRNVVQPISGKQDYYANPHRPEFWDCRTGVMIRMANADPSYLQKGDIVWITFFVEFIIRAHTWATQLTPRHFIRVGTVPRILLDSAYGKGGRGEEEPDYTIEEGAKFVLHVDFPMDDDATEEHDTVNEAGALRDETSQPSGSILKKENETLNLALPEDVMSTQDTEGTVVVNIASSDRPHSNGDKQPFVHASDNDMDEDRTSLTPLSATPGPTTPTASEWNPSPTSKQTTGDDDKTTATRGTKREGDSDDMEIVPPAKKARQTGTRRPRKV